MTINIGVVWKKTQVINILRVLKVNNKDYNTELVRPLLDAMVIKSCLIMEKGQKTLIVNLLVIIDRRSLGRLSCLPASPM